ncbi:uncharacterized protein LACBIDRAFT_328409 [Laccaria bicolor S238N-H82]|uniref:Predicted protein n=1 Tax=Laccaria bicolor (strain S238N-H82 / ATCC MYA-4686) TaxID=486041 RepID=B0DES6_LACBS|nr:uncharacterized protein LACBIDRAFT_328409 [Laccaria bicolor S238N-H82]EDR07079.1 predicted protein [Laccaria bicolor S238N-H82]|eukprot:XP_001882452.1 predicted protein [Laccaria bicolor S238N-H82]
MVDVPSPVMSGFLACKSPTSTYDIYGLPANVYIPSLDYFAPHVANMSLTACHHVTSTTSQRRGHMGESIMIAGKGAIGGFDFELVASICHTGQYFTIPHIIHMDSTGFHWIPLDFTTYWQYPQNWTPSTKLDSTGLHWTASTNLDWTGLDWTGLQITKLDSTGLS